MDKTFIKNLKIRAILGILDRERVTPQDVIVNVTVFTDPRPVNAPDDISICVDYAALTEEIRTLVEGAQRFTVEALAEDIAGVCLRRPEVRKAIVRVEKPEAVKEAGSVGVEIERCR